MKSLFALSLILIGALTVSAQKVKVGSDPAFDLSTCKTYAWAKPLPMGNPYVQQAVLAAVDQAMAAKGLTKVEDNGDLMVAYFSASQSDAYIANPSTVHQGGSSLSTGMAVGSQGWPVTQGTLVVDIEDGKTKNSVWRASATQTLDHGPTGNAEKDAKSVEKPIKKAVEKMFKQFPRPN
jgi:hypothetical protein